MSLELGQLINYYMKEFFIENYAENMHQKLVADVYFVLVNRPKHGQCVQET